MAKARATYAKRMRELQQMERKQAKAERRERRKGTRDDGAPDVDGDPDLAGIVPGPVDRESVEDAFDGLF